MVETARRSVKPFPGLNGPARPVREPDFPRVRLRPVSFSIAWDNRKKWGRWRGCFGLEAGYTQGGRERITGFRDKGLRAVDSSRKVNATHPGPVTVEAEAPPVPDEIEPLEEPRTSAVEARN